MTVGPLVDSFRTMQQIAAGGFGAFTFLSAMNKPDLSFIIQVLSVKV
jgi:hypothetical protein